MNYLSHLNKEGLISKMEYKLLHFVYRLFRLEIAPFGCLSMLYVFGIVFSFLCFSVVFIGVVLLLVYAVVYGADTSFILLPSFKQRAWHMIMIGSFFWLIMQQVISADLQKEYCRYCHEFFKKNSLQPKYKISIIFLFLLSFFLSIYLFKHNVIVYLLLVVSLIIIVESIKDIVAFNNLKSWKRVILKDIRFNMVHTNVIKIAGVRDFYSLKAKYCYEVDGEEYCDTKIYIDQTAARGIFETPHKYLIKNWLSRHTDIKYAYYNPSHPCQAVLFKDVLFSSYLLKLFIIVGTLLVVYVVNFAIDWEYYFS